MTAAKTWPKVTVQSDRPARGGRVVRGEAGQGTVMPDEPDKVYVTGDGWYGEWPVSETDIVDQIKEEEALRKAAGVPEGASLGSFTDGYQRLIEKLREHDPSLAQVDRDVEPILLTKDGRYLRLPTLEEFHATFADLQNRGLVED